MSQTKIMVAFKEKFPYLRTDRAIFEFDRDWLHRAITRADRQAATELVLTEQ